MLERDLDLRGRGGLGPPQELKRILFVLGQWNTVVEKDLAAEVQGFGRDHRLQHRREFLGGQVGVHALVLVGDHDVDAIGMVTDVLIDPVEFDLQLFRRESDRTQHPESAGLAHGDHDVAAVGEREDGELDAEIVTDWGVHGVPRNAGYST